MLCSPSRGTLREKRNMRGRCTDIAITTGWARTLASSQDMGNAALMPVIQNTRVCTGGDFSSISHAVKEQSSQVLGLGVQIHSPASFCPTFPPPRAFTRQLCSSSKGSAAHGAGLPCSSQTITMARTEAIFKHCFATQWQERCKKIIIQLSKKEQ